MTLHHAHALVLACSCSLALLCVLLGHVLPELAWCSLLAPWLSAWLSVRHVAWPTWAGTLMALGAFAYSTSLLLRHGLNTAMTAACAALVGIFVARLLTRRTPGHDLQSLVLSLLLVLAGTVLQQQLSYGVILLAYTIVVTWALVTRQLMHGAAMEAYRTADLGAHQATLQRRDVVTPRFFAATAGVAGVILMGTGLLFLVFPRVGLGGFGFGRRQSSQFPGDVSLAGPSRADGDDTVVARIWGLDYSQFARGLYLRGALYDVPSSAGFTSATSLMQVAPGRLALATAAQQAGAVDYEVFLQPVAEQVLLALGPVLQATPKPGAFAGPAALERIGLGPTGELISLSPLLGPVRYRVHGGLTLVPPPPLPTPTSTQGVAALEFDDAKFKHHFLTLPPALDRRIVPLAQKIVGDANSFAYKATRLRHYLLKNFTYSLSQDNSGRADPLASFLFEKPRGHCEYFATAFAILLRAVGVPSRVVGGFEGGSWDPTGPTVVFTSANAHAWVEWYEPHRGWVADDATPLSEPTTLSGAAIWLERLRRVWDDEIVDFGLDQQLAMVRSVVDAVHSSGLGGVHAWSPARLLWQVALFCLGVGVLGLGGVWLKRLSGRRHGPPKQVLTPLADVLLHTLRRLTQAQIPEHQTLRQVANTVVPQLAQPDARALYAVVQAYERQRFAAASVSPKDVRQARQRLKGIELKARNC